MKKRILIILGIIMMFIVSCGGKHPAVKDFEDNMKIVQSGDTNKISDGSNKTFSSDVTPEMKAALGEGFKKITYKINKVETKDKTATINVTIKYPDYSIFGNEFHNMITEKYKSSNISSKAEVNKIVIQEATKFFNEKIKENKLSYSEKTIDVILEKQGNNWVLIGEKNLELISILTLGLDK